MATGNPPSGKQRAAAAGAKQSGGVRNKATAAASAAQPELAPVLQGVNAAHNRVFGGKGRLVAGARNRLVLIEFLVCFVILGLGTIVAPEGQKNSGASHLAVKGSALALLFFILGLMSGGGARSAKAAGALGGLVTAAYVFTSRDSANLIKWVDGFFSSSSASTGAGEAAGKGIGSVGGGVTGAGEAVGSVAGGLTGAAE